MVDRYCIHGHLIAGDNARLVGGRAHKGTGRVKCRLCANESAMRWVRRNAANNNKHTRRWRYTTDSEAHFAAQMKRQKGRCALCPTKLVRPHRDHSHRCCKSQRSCGRCLRGLLCAVCNMRLRVQLEQKLLLLEQPDCLSKWERRAFNYVWKWERLRLLELTPYLVED